jgi:uncharacterized protein (TIGR01777 family)
MKIAITGGAGFVGSALAAAFVEKGHEVLILDRNAPRKELPGRTFLRTDLISDFPTEAYLACDAVVHLAGVNIFGRWTPEYKKQILSSRIDTARTLIDAVEKSGRGPKIFISASAVGYYGEGGEAELTEASPRGNDFLATVCAAWEDAAHRAEQAGMRAVSVRTGIVLGPGGGMLAKLIPVFRGGLGGPMGSGRQWFSWIYIKDLIAVYVRAVLDDAFSGPVNAVAPHPVRNKELARALGKALHRPSFIPVPAFALRLVLGELASVVVMSQRVIPEKLLASGFVFLEPAIDGALTASVGNKSAKNGA